MQVVANSQEKEFCPRASAKNVALLIDTLILAHLS
jgi:hypothetical protein